MTDETIRRSTDDNGVSERPSEPGLRPLSPTDALALQALQERRRLELARVATEIGDRIAAYSIPERRWVMAHLAWVLGMGER